MAGEGEVAGVPRPSGVLDLHLHVVSIPVSYTSESHPSYVNV